MTTVREIAQDPRKALIDLEKRLGVEPGGLLRDMERLATPGADWDKHLPYRVAASYYDDHRARAAYESHVNECGYCKNLLDSLHPTGVGAMEFARKAARFHAASGKGWTVHAAPFAVAAGVVMFTIGGGALLKSQPSVLHADPAIQGWVSEVKIGGGGDPQNPIVDGKVEAIPAGQPVHLVTEIQGAPSHTPVSVVWFGPNGREVRKETNWTTEASDSIAFAAPDTSAWKSGGYRAELWVASEKVKQERFEIRQMGEAAKAE